MDIYEILEKVDHTLLSQTATWEEIKQVCDDGVKYKTASVCIPPCFVKRAAEYLEGKLPVCTVIGFPNGYSKTSVKVFETEEAVRDGASEIDMVINLGMLREGRDSEVLEEIKAVREACSGRILKVIIETCLLTEDEKVRMCRIVSESGADFIKTSTGFGGGGATREDVRIFSANIAPHLKIKAAGGIRSEKDAEDFIKLGAARLGTSSIVRLVKARENS